MAQAQTHSEMGAAKSSRGNNLELETVTRDELAGMLKCSTETLKRRERAGLLKRIPFGGRMVRYSRPQVKAVFGL